MKIIVTGSQGFIGSYLCNELLHCGHSVIGFDNYSKYGALIRAHNSHPNFTLYAEDVLNLSRYDMRIQDVDMIIAGAAMIGGITYFHQFAYDLLATNERITANTFDIAIHLFKEKTLKRIVNLSSSMVFESATEIPTKESDINTCPIPQSTYGFQKLATEFFCRGAFEQYGLPYTIIRPFNCVGIGEDGALKKTDMTIGNMTMMMSHVLPDLVYRALLSKPDDPLHILGSGEQIRHYTNGRDIARGIRLAVESDAAVCQDFNISIDKSHTVKELAEMVWQEIHNCPPILISQEGYPYDVQVRSPDIKKAQEILGFQAEISLEESVKEVVEWMKARVTNNALHSVT